MVVVVVMIVMGSLPRTEVCNRKDVPTKVVSLPLLELLPLPPEEHVGWIWMVKMREGGEEAEDAWVAENPRDAIAEAQAMYPDARLVSCHRREEITTYLAVRRLLDGRVLPF